MIMGRTTFDELLNKHRIKENIISTLSTKVDDLPKIEIKKEAMKEENHAIKKYFLGRKSKYSVFKHIKDYLQSNDITLNEIIQKNPFQSRPFIIQGSEEFLKAVKFSEYEEVDYMLRKDKKLLFSIDYFGQTAYHWATKLSDYKMLDILISFGKHHNQKDFKGRTPIYLAAANNKEDMCKFLLENHANIFLKDKENKTPVDVAGSIELKYFLKEYLSQPFNNPVYKLKMKKILEEREGKINKNKELSGKEKFIGVVEQLFDINKHYK